MSSLAPIRFDPNGPADTGLQAWETIDPSTLTAGEPVQRGHVYFCNATGALTAGVWDCTPMTGKLEPYAVNEFMLILEGSVTIVDARGHAQTLHAGEIFVIPKGTPFVWKQTEYMRKYYVIFDDPSGTCCQRCHRSESHPGKYRVVPFTGTRSGPRALRRPRARPNTRKNFSPT